MHARLIFLAYWYRVFRLGKKVIVKQPYRRLYRSADRSTDATDHGGDGCDQVSQPAELPDTACIARQNGPTTLRCEAAAYRIHKLTKWWRIDLAMAMAMAMAFFVLRSVHLH